MYLKEETILSSWPQIQMCFKLNFEPMLLPLEPI